MEVLIPPDTKIVLWSYFKATVTTSAELEEKLSLLFRGKLEIAVDLGRGAQTPTIRNDLKDVVNSFTIHVSYVLWKRTAIFTEILKSFNWVSPE